MNTMQLTCFVEVASTLNFSKAAANLNVSQPTVSHQIKSLEDELGCALITRSTRSVALTDEGVSFLGYAYDILEISGRAMLKVSGKARTGGNTLRVGVNDGMEAYLVSPVFAELYRRDSTFDPAIRMGPHSAMVDMLDAGSVDVVLEYRDPHGAPASSTVFRRLYDAPAAIAVSEGHPVAGIEGPLDGLEACGEWGRVALTMPQGVSPALMEMQRELINHTDPADSMMCPSVEGTLAIVGAGIAYTILPDMSAMRQPGLRFIPVEGLKPAAFGARVRRGRQPQVLNDFLEVLAQHLAGAPIEDRH